MNDVLRVGLNLYGAAEAKEPELSMGGLLAYTAFVLLIVFGLMAWAKKGLNTRFFTHWMTQRFEQLYLFLETLAVGIIGPAGRKYMPMLMTFWTVIFVSNVVSLFFAAAPTGNLSFNMALALIVIGYVQWEGIKNNGFIGHFSHFAGPKMGGALVLINIMLFAIELVSEMMKNLSLSLRLYGNIHGGHEAASKITDLTASHYIAAGSFLLPVKFLTCVVQSMIFCLLTCVYLSLVQAHDHHHDDDHGTHADTEVVPAH